MGESGVLVRRLGLGVDADFNDVSFALAMPIFDVRVGKFEAVGDDGRGDIGENVALEEMQVVRPVSLYPRFKAHSAINEFGDGLDSEVFDGGGAMAFDLECVTALGETMHGFVCRAICGARVNRNFPGSSLVQRQLDRAVAMCGE